MVTDTEMSKRQFQKPAFSISHSYHVTAEEMRRFDNSDLPEILDEKIEEYCENCGIKRSNALIADLCQTNEKTLRNYISGKYYITRKFLYKFTVGLSLSLEDANDLFAICGGELNEDCREDYIVMRALIMGDDIDDFIKNYNEHVLIKENRIKTRDE